MQATTGIYRNIRDEISRVPIIDAHDHIADHRHGASGRSVGAFVFGGWMSMVTGITPSGGATDDDALWRAFLKVWPEVRMTGPGMVLANVFRLWDIGPEIDERSYDLIAARLRDTSPQAIGRLWTEYGIQGAITHYLGHPSCGGIENLGSYLSGELTFEPNVFPLLGILPLHEFHQPSDIGKLEALADREITSLSDLEEVIGTLIHRARQQGVVGLKDHSAYSRGLAFDVPLRHRAELELSRLRHGADSVNGEDVFPDTRGLSDYLFHAIVRFAVDLHLPIAVHTGILAGGATPPGAHVLDPQATEEFLCRALGALPAHRIIGFGADYLTSSERQIGSAELARDLIAAALTRSIERSWVSVRGATEIARLLLYENPRNLYKLPI